VPLLTHNFYDIFSGVILRLYNNYQLPIEPLTNTDNSTNWKISILIISELLTRI